MYQIVPVPGKKFQKKTLRNQWPLKNVCEIQRPCNFWGREVHQRFTKLLLRYVWTDDVIWNNQLRDWLCLAHWMKDRMTAWTKEEMTECLKEGRNEYINQWMNQWVNIWRNQWKKQGKDDGWINHWMNQCMNGNINGSIRWSLTDRLTD